MRPLGTAIYKKFLGTANIDEAVRTLREGVTGKRGTFFTTAENAYIDDGNLVHSRPGYTSLFSGDYHSLWSDKINDIVLAVKDGNLMRLIPGTASEAVIHAGVGSTPMSYAVYGATIYYTNGTVIGAIEDYTARALRTPTFTYKRTMPAGYLIEVYRGRLFLAKKVGDYNLVIYSDPADPESYDERNDKSFFSFPEPLTMLHSVNDGLYLSSNNTKFYNGASPEKMTRLDISDYPAFAGSAQKAQNVKYGDLFFKTAVYWTSRDGVFCGGDDAFYVNLIGSRWRPTITGSGCSLLTQGDTDQYLSIMKEE